MGVLRSKGKIILIFQSHIRCLAHIGELRLNIEMSLTDPKDQAILGTLLVIRDTNDLITGDKALLAVSDEYANCRPADF